MKQFRSRNIQQLEFVENRNESADLRSVLYQIIKGLFIIIIIV